MLHDLRYAVRMLLRNGGATVVTVLALGIGIGVNVTVFTAYKAFFTRALDARAPREMVNLALIRDSGVTDFTFSYPDYEAYRDSLHSFSGLIAFRLTQVKTSNSGKAETNVFIVSDNYFKVLGVAAIQGRTFDPLTERATTASVLISENYWQRKFARDPGILGRTLYINGVAVTVIGITPHDFIGTGVSVPAFWIPISMEPLIQADDQWLTQPENQRYRLFGRLGSGATMTQAQEEMTATANHLRGLHDPHSESARPAKALVWPGSPSPLPLNQYPGPQLFVELIVVAAGMVLVVACANVGSLQLARARSRQNELSTRLALGAGRLRLIRQLLTESAVVGLLAGLAALLSTWALLKILVRLTASILPVEFGSLVFDVTPDMGIFVGVCAVSLIAGMLSGFVPALESSHSALSSAIRGSTSSIRSRRLQDIFVAAQVAVSVVLLIAGAMAIRSSIKSLSIEPGYDTRHVIDVDFQFEGLRYTAARKLAVVRELRARFENLPGVAAITMGRPPGQAYRTAAVASDTETTSTKSVQSLVKYSYVEGNYFQTLGLSVFLGRPFQLGANVDQNSAIISESVARQFWKDQNPVGRSLRLGTTDERFHTERELVANGEIYTVIGVVPDTRGMEFDGSHSKSVYLLRPNDRVQNYSMLVRTHRDAAQVRKAINEEISSVDPDLMATVATLDEMLRVSPAFLTSSLSAAIASAIGLFGLLLALMGIYGTVSYIVVLRTREVGIRMAIGAQKRNILKLILRESIRPVVVGLIVGIILAGAASYLARGLLYGINGIDGIASVGVSILFLLVTLLASYPPARRAMRVDPMVALRYE